MSEDPYLFPRPQRKYRWSYQFGLYRYDSDDRSVKYRNILMKRSNIQYFAILAMFGIAILVVCFLMYTSSSEEIEELPLHETTLEEYPSVIRKIIDTKHNSTIIKLANFSAMSNSTAEQLIQPIPNLYLIPPPTTQNSILDDLVAVETSKTDDKFHPLYFDEYIPNLQPPPKKSTPSEMRRNYILPPNPFRFINSGPRPQAFGMHHQNIDRKFPQIYDNYRYPQNAMNIQDIIKYLTHKRGRNLNKITFTGKFQNINPDSSTQVNRNQNHDNGLLLTGEQFFNDPFYKFKPSDPSDINLLAPNQFRFAPSLLQNHRFVPAKEDIPNNRIRKAKPVSLMLDIYPMSEEVEEVDKFGTRKPIFIRPMYNPGNNYNNLNSLYHLSSYPNQQPTIVPKPQINKINKNQNLNIYDVTGFQYNNANRYIPQLQQEPHRHESDLEKMIVHLNLYPRKKVHARSGSDITQNHEKIEDSLLMESTIQNTTISTSSEVGVKNLTVPKIDDSFLLETLKNQMENLNEKESTDEHQYSENKKSEIQENPNPEMDESYLLETLKAHMQETPTEETTSHKKHTEIPNFTTTSENPKIYIFSPQAIDDKENSFEKYSTNNYNSNEQVSQIQSNENTTPIKNFSKYSVSLESGFYPIRFNNQTFHSEPLDKNYMADLAAHYAKKSFSKEPNLETHFNSSEIVHFYEPRFNSYIDRSDNFTTENENLNDNLDNVSTWTLDSLEVNPNLKNHKPFFSEVNDTLVKSS